MGRNALPFCAWIICFNSSMFGTQSSSGFDTKLQNTCPGNLDPMKIFCCQTNGYHCCDEVEFTGEGRKYESYANVSTLCDGQEEGASGSVARKNAVPIGIGIGGMIIPMICFIAYYCCCYENCQFYWCHSKVPYGKMVESLDESEAENVSIVVPETPSQDTKDVDIISRTACSVL